MPINITKSNSKNLVKIFLIFIFIILISIAIHIIDSKSFFQNFSTIFISIILESIPFILLASLVSSLMQEFISEKFITKIIPKNKFLAFLGASLLGFVFPICECAIVPITKRLIKKGVPLEIAFTFMLSVPIVNPVVLMSTYYAFYNKPLIFILRAVLGILVPILIGILISYYPKSTEYSPIKNSIHDSSIYCNCGCTNTSNLYINTSKIRIILEV